MPLEDSEFGGHSGLIQPAPHPVQGREQAFLERACDPADETVGPDQILAQVYAGEYPIRPLPEAAELLPLQPDVMLVQTTQNPGIGFGFIGVGNIDLRSAQLKASTTRQMTDAQYGPIKTFSAQVAPLLQLEIGSLAPGHYFYQVVMNGVQVTDVMEVDVV
jgi:hypothetical protein